MKKIIYSFVGCLLLSCNYSESSWWSPSTWFSSSSDKLAAGTSIGVVGLLALATKLYIQNLALQERLSGEDYIIDTLQDFLKNESVFVYIRPTQLMNQKDTMNHTSILMIENLKGGGVIKREEPANIDPKTLNASDFFQFKLKNEKTYN
ncbi:MAG: hypothetical protein WC707_02295 [Candidatus Babeliaceae bacterium]|jgi:hypothetical protein